MLRCGFQRRNDGVSATNQYRNCAYLMSIVRKSKKCKSLIASIKGQLFGGPSERDLLNFFSADLLLNLPKSLMAHFCKFFEKVVSDWLFTCAYHEHRAECVDGSPACWSFIRCDGQWACDGELLRRVVRWDMRSALLWWARLRVSGWFEALRHWCMVISLCSEFLSRSCLASQRLPADFLSLILTFFE